MPGALIELTKTGRITRIYILADSSSEEAVVYDALARITRLAVWAWLFRLFRRQR